MIVKNTEKITLIQSAEMSIAVSAVLALIASQQIAVSHLSTCPNMSSNSPSPFFFFNPKE